MPDTPKPAAEPVPVPMPLVDRSPTAERLSAVLLPDVAATLASLRMIQPPAEPPASVPGGPPPVPLVDPPTEYEPGPPSDVPTPPRVEWPLGGPPPSTEPPAGPVLAVGDQVTVTASGTTFEATVTAVTPSGGGAAEQPPATDPTPVDPSAE
ncbi:hypothetical protein [Amycolatopsis kentuckyensis]|uniref:hypothetical protein n=1 Tax=Amycolatopsis kentuckyensis TaxID=218823 RepID=UPI00356ABC91